MIPIQLSIEGLYSYQEKQTIDFTTLLKGGLFGIFGKVGSGKSSILEAISFGLYGETERLNQKDNRAYNMMNLKSNRATIEFEFYNYENKRYKIYREYRRNGKKYHDVKRENAILYQFQNDQWIPLSNFDMQEIIGLSYANFKRTIIIPQGKFKEFIELGGKDRTKMMQEIFGLDRFDLSNKVKSIYTKTKQQYDQITGQLQTYSSLDPSIIAELQQKIEFGTVEVNQLVAQFNSHNERYGVLKLVSNDLQELKQKQEALQVLDSQADQISILEQKLQKYQLYKEVFENLFKDKNSTTIACNKSKELLQKFTQEFRELTTSKQHIEKELEILEPLYLSLDKPRRTLVEYKLIVQIKINEEKLNALILRQQKGVQEVNKQKELTELAKQEILACDKQIDALKHTMLSSEQLLLIAQWFNDLVFMEQSLVKLKSGAQEFQALLHDIGKEINSFGFTTNDYRSELEAQRTELNQRFEKLSIELEDLNVSQRLSLYAHELHPGAACPLCGSTSHPNVIHSNELSVLIEQKKEELDHVKSLLELSRVKENKASVCFEKLHFTQQQFELGQQEIIAIELQIAKHQQSFIWQAIVAPNQEDFNALKVGQQRLMEQIQILEQTQLKCRKELEQHGLNLDKYNQALGNIELQINGLKSENHATELQFVEVDIANYKNTSVEQIKFKSDQLHQQIIQTEQKYGSYTQQNLSLAPLLGAKEQQVKQCLVDVEESTSKLIELDKHIEQCLKQHNITTQTDVEVILQQNMNTTALRTQIDDFRVKWAIAKDQVNQLKAKLEGTSFDQNEFNVLQKNIENLEKQLLAKRDVIAQLSAELKRCENELAQKAKLLVTYEALERRLSNLGTLDNMFKGAGFVNYVSSIYLKNLCEMANKRFHRLTNNHLSLQLNEANDFEIIDYLNNGKSRSVKTLSGGQGFQVSLSLALALAESVQSLSKSDNNFFFIDEGFGTLDQESINIVFETLNDLKSHNRMVGIISHVDELQERITMSLSVSKDDQKGSVISQNY